MCLENGSLRITEIKFIIQSEFLCPENSPQPLGHTQPQGLQEALAPQLSLTNSADPHFLTSLPAQFPKWGGFSAQNKKGKVGLPDEQSLEEIF